MVALRLNGCGHRLARAGADPVLDRCARPCCLCLQNRARFPSIDNRELDSRRGFVTDAKTSLSQSDEHIKRISQKASQAGNKRKVGTARMHGVALLVAARVRCCSR